MPRHDLIVIGTSAGGQEALQQLVRDLPADLSACVCLVQHLAPHSRGLLPELLSRSGPLPAMECTDGMPLAQGSIVVAPPDRHMLVWQGTLRLSHGPKENHHRPSVDVLFRSAAVAAGPRVVGVILTGMLDDGTAGLRAVKQCGGIAVVQEPQDALYPSMPQNALQHVAVDYTVPLSELAALLVRLAHQDAEEESPERIPAVLKQEVQMAAMEKMDLPAQSFGAPSEYSCPDCGGVLQERQEESLLRFRCQVGHAFSVESLLAVQPDILEQALWSALKTLREREHLLQRLSDQAQQAGLPALTVHSTNRLRETRQHIFHLEQVLQ